MHKRILDARESLKFASDCFDKTVKAVQSACGHKNIVECGRYTYHFGDTIPSIRLCLDCGISEEVWYEYTATVLKNPDPQFGLRTVSRDYIHQNKVGQVITYEEKCADD